MLKKDLEEIKKSHLILNNAITEIRNIGRETKVEQLR